MTIGIIDKVFANWKYHEDIEILKQELKAEIEKEFDRELEFEGYRAHHNEYLQAVENWKKALLGNGEKQE